MSTLKKNLLKGTVWSIGGVLCSLLVTFATNIWLARLLSPQEFGEVGIIMFFITLFTVFTEGGLAGALVRKKEATEDDYSTVFVFNFVISIFCFLLLVLFSGIIANYYHNPNLEKILIVSGFVLIINSFQITQNARLISELKFKQKYIYRFCAVLIASVVGIICAYQGFGVWALIIIQLLTAGLFTIILWIWEGTFFKLYFNKESFKELYGYGVNTTLASLLNTAFDNIYQVILGKYFSISEVGYFYQAKKLQDIPGGIINMITQNVVFSSLSKLQDDKAQFMSAYNKIMLMFTVTLGLTSSLMYLYAENIIMLFYGQKWVGSIFYMQVLTIASFFYLQELFNRTILKVFNQTKQILYLEFIKKGIQLVSIVLGLYFLNLKILIFGFALTNILNYGINFYFSRRIMGKVSFYELIVVVKIFFISAFLTFLVLQLCNYLKIENNTALLFIPVFVIAYFLSLSVFKIFNLFLEFRNIKNLITNKS